MVILSSTGVQGDDISGLTMIINMFNLSGLLMARAYAISNHHKLVAWVLGLLCIGNIGCDSVCLCTFSLYLDGLNFYGISQYVTVNGTCKPTDMQLNDILL